MSLLQVEHNVDQMLQHYSSEGWLTYREPAAPLSRQTSVRVRPSVLTYCTPQGRLAAESADACCTWQAVPLPWPYLRRGHCSVQQDVLSSAIPGSASPLHMYADGAGF